MSAQVTIQRTFTTTTTSAILVNVGYLKTLPGLLKLFQILLGAVAVGIIGYYIPWNNYQVVAELFFLLIATTCLITTTVIVFSCVFSIATASILPKTLFETAYHIVATILYVAAGITLLVYVTDDRRRYVTHYEAKIAAAVVSVNSTECYLLFCASVNLLRDVVARNQQYSIKEIGYHSKLFSGDGWSIFGTEAGTWEPRLESPTLLSDTRNSWIPMVDLGSLFSPLALSLSIGLVNAALYLLSTLYSIKTFKRG